MTLPIFPAVHSVEPPAVHAHCVRCTPGSTSMDARGVWIPGQARNDAWVWGWMVVYRLFRPDWISGQARNDVVGPRLYVGHFSIHELRPLHISLGSYIQTMKRMPPTLNCNDE